MNKISIEEFQKNFDVYLDRVYEEESFIVISEYGKAVLTQYCQEKEVDDLIRIHTDHEEGC